MAEKRDLSAIHQGALKKAFDVQVASRRALKDRIEQPMLHGGEKSPEERQAETRMWAAEPALITAAHREAATRWNLQPDKPVSRRYAEMLIDRFKELREAE